FSFTYVSGPGRPVYNDPLFVFYATVNVGRDPGWVTRVRQEYVVRRDNVAMRPPRTYIEQTRIIERNLTVINNGRGQGQADQRTCKPRRGRGWHASGARERRVAAAMATAGSRVAAVPQRAVDPGAAGCERADGRNRRRARPGLGPASAADAFRFTRGGTDSRARGNP